MIRPALTAMTTALLIACGGGSSDSPAPTVNSMDDISVRKIGIDLVNISTQPVDFYIRETGDTNPLFDTGNKVASNPNYDTQYHGISWTSASPMRIDIGIEDTNSQTEQTEVNDVVLNDTEKLWAIAWQDGDELTLSTDVEMPAPLEDKYRIRIFSIADTWVQVVSTAVSTMEVKKGKFSPHMTLENCSGELYLGANPTDICDLDIGKSYLLIVNGEDLLLAAEER
ncbi:hypothetical protein L4C36_09835 [Photobacterium japonica]|uniref:hypothetical protein n=1 Tax=Photobacterium japonica TaxID=2910235 RepID=UPI003D1471C9